MLRKFVTLLALIQPFCLFGFQQIGFIKSDPSTPTLINHVCFHPKKNLFCTTFTHQHWIGLYQVGEDDRVELRQKLIHPETKFLPQDAIFSHDGNQLVVVSWASRNFFIYQVNPEGSIQSYPTCTVATELSHEKYRPHGMRFSSNGNYLAVVYGSFHDSPWTVILYRVCDLGTDHAMFIPCCSLQKSPLLKGTPKGIAFSPDESCLVITFTKTNRLAVFPIDLESGWISPVPAQEISGSATKLCRPEDIVFAPDGSYCAVSNSSQDTVTFYQFRNNRFVSEAPFKTLDADLWFPHGLSFSFDGKYFAVTQFGKVKLNASGRLTTWGEERVEGISLFKVF